MQVEIEKQNEIERMKLKLMKMVEEKKAQRKRVEIPRRAAAVPRPTPATFGKEALDFMAPLPDGVSQPPPLILPPLQAIPRERLETVTRTKPGFFGPRVDQFTQAVRCNKIDLLRALQEAHLKLHDACHDLNRWQKDIVRLSFWHYQGRSTRGANIERAAVGAAERLGKKVAPPPLPVRLAAVAAQDEGAVHETVNALVEDWRTFLISSVTEALQALCDNEVVGQINWIESDVCAYHYYRLVHDSPKAIHTLLYHELIGASRSPAASPAVPLPEWVQQLLAATPPWLRQSLQVIEGHEIFSRTVEKEVESEEITDQSHIVFRTDPALVLGPFVIAGW